MWSSKIGSVRHFGADKSDPLFENVGDEADPTGEAIKPGNDNLRVFALSQPIARCSSTRELSASGLNVAEFGDQYPGA